MASPNRASNNDKKRLVQAWPAPLDEAALHGPAGEFVRLVEPHTEADRVALLSQFLVGVGNIIGRHAHFKVEADRHYLNLFMGLVGETSKGRKGTAWGHAKSILSRIDDCWKKRIMGGLSSGEGLIWQVRDPLPEDPGVQDKRLLVLESELAGVLRVLAREGNTLSAIIREAWDHGDLRTLTKNSPACATDSYISIIGHVTREELRRYLDRTEMGNGFANRFLWLCTRRANVLPEGGRIDEVDFQPLLSTLRKVVQFAKTPRELKKTEMAREVWAANYPDLSEGRPGLLGAVTGRAEAQVMRLAALYAVLDRSAEITDEHIFAALALWDYAFDSASYIFGVSTGNPVADEILALVRQSGEVTRTEINNHFGRNKKKEALSRALEVLEDARLIHKESRETPGRPVEVWSLTSNTS